MQPEAPIITEGRQLVHNTHNSQQSNTTASFTWIHALLRKRKCKERKWKNGEKTITLTEDVCVCECLCCVWYLLFLIVQHKQKFVYLSLTLSSSFPSSPPPWPTGVLSSFPFIKNATKLYDNGTADGCLGLQKCLMQNNKITVCCGFGY